MPSNDELTVVVEPDGNLKFIYSDALAVLMEEGHATVTRASHVEFIAGGWRADLTPSGGPVLPPMACHGCELRQDALDLERAWLRVHKGL